MDEPWLELMCGGRRPHATNLPKLAAKNVKNRPGAEFDTEIGAGGTEHFLSFAERADYSGATLMPSLETLSCGAESVLRLSVGNSELVQRIRLQTRAEAAP